MSIELNSLQDQLADVEVFMASRAYRGYCEARRREIQDVKNRILLLRPISQDMISQQLIAFGELDTLEEMVEIFEDTRTTLKARISEITNRENESASNTKV